MHVYEPTNHTQYYLGPLCVCVQTLNILLQIAFSLDILFESMLIHFLKSPHIPSWFITNGEVNVLQIYFSSPLTVGDFVLLQTICNIYSGAGGSILRNCC